MSSDSESAQDDNWMLSYIDVFVLMTTIFVMLLVMNRSETNVGGVIGSDIDYNGTATKSVDIDLTAKDYLQVSENETEIDLFIRSSTLWLEDIKSSLKENELGGLVNLQESDDFTSLEIQSRVLFNSGSSDLARSGESLLEKLIPVLKQSEGLIFIEGHTDDQPIASNEYPSNWDLASARATEVLHFFVTEGLAKKRFRAVSYGDTEPLVPNDSEENRSKNRRVSLMIQRRL